ncbi:MAG: hypothetical protein ACK41Q_07180 [Candidatus Brocadia sp.]
MAIDNNDASGKIYNLVDIYVANMTVAGMERELCGSGSIIYAPLQTTYHSI